MKFYGLSYDDWRALPAGLYNGMVQYQQEYHRAQQQRR